MKITRTTDIQPAIHSKPQSRGNKASSHGSSDGGPTRASLSKDAGFVQGTRELASSGGDIRPDKVADAKALLASGGLSASVNMDTMLDSVLGDL